MPTHFTRKSITESQLEAREPKLRKASTLKNRTLDRMRNPGDMDNTLERIRNGDMDLYSVPSTPVFDALRFVSKVFCREYTSWCWNKLIFYTFEMQFYELCTLFLKVCNITLLLQNMQTETLKLFHYFIIWYFACLLHCTLPFHKMSSSGTIMFLWPWIRMVPHIGCELKRVSFTRPLHLTLTKCSIILWKILLYDKIWKLKIMWYCILERR